MDIKSFLINRGMISCIKLGEGAAVQVEYLP